MYCWVDFYLNSWWSLLFQQYDLHEQLWLWKKGFVVLTTLFCDKLMLLLYSTEMVIVYRNVFGSFINDCTVSTLRVVPKWFVP